jgi:hypothetical protein
MSSPVGCTGPVKCVNNPIFMVDGAAGAGGGVGVKVKKATLIPTAAIITIAAIIIAVVLVIAKKIISLIIHQAQNQEVS